MGSSLAKVDAQTQCLLLAPGYPATLPRLSSDPLDLGHSVPWLSRPVAAGAAFVFVDLQSLLPHWRLMGWRSVDLILTQVADRLRRLAPTAAIFRTGPDAFMIAEEHADANDATSYIAGIEAAIGEPISAGDEPTMLHLTATVAMTIASSPLEPSELFTAACETLDEVHVTAGNTLVRVVGHPTSG